MIQLSKEGNNTDKIQTKKVKIIKPNHENIFNASNQDIMQRVDNKQFTANKFAASIVYKKNYRDQNLIESLCYIDDLDSNNKVGRRLNNPSVKKNKNRNNNSFKIGKKSQNSVTIDSKGVIGIKNMIRSEQNIKINGN